MTESQTARERITDEVTSWPGVEAGAGRRGAFAFKSAAGRSGTCNGDHAAHFLFPKQVWPTSSTKVGWCPTRSSPECRGRLRAQNRG
jgi:hypothetical protein